MMAARRLGKASATKSAAAGRVKVPVGQLELPVINEPPPRRRLCAPVGIAGVVAVDPRAGARSGNADGVVGDGPDGGAIFDREAI